MNLFPVFKRVGFLMFVLLCNTLTSHPFIKVHGIGNSLTLIVNNLLGLFIDETFSAERAEKLSVFISKVIFRGVELFHTLRAHEPKNPCHGNNLLDPFLKFYPVHDLLGDLNPFGIGPADGLRRIDEHLVANGVDIG